MSQFLHHEKGFFFSPHGQLMPQQLGMTKHVGLWSMFILNYWRILNPSCFRNPQLVERLQVTRSHHSKQFHILSESARSLIKATNNITPNGEVIMK